MDDNNDYLDEELVEEEPDFHETLEDIGDAIGDIRDRINERKASALNEAEENAANEGLYNKSEEGKDGIKNNEENPGSVGNSGNSAEKGGLYKESGKGRNIKGGGGSGVPKTSGTGGGSTGSPGGGGASSVGGVAAGGKFGAAAGAAAAAQNGNNKKDGEGKGKGKINPVMAVSLVAMAALAALVIIPNWPKIAIYSIANGLWESSGITKTIAALKEQGAYASEEIIKTGEIPTKYARDLARTGVELGQVTVAGEFLPLETVASLEDNYYRSKDNGPLSVRFEGEIIAAEDFAENTLSNPRLFAAYSDAADLPTKFYYSKEVDDVFKDMGLSRNNFRDWKRTGDSEADMNSFNTLLKKALDGDSEVTVSGCKDECFHEKVSSGNDAEAIVNAVSEKTTGEDATGKASQLLNTAISASEPYKAAKAFMAVIDPIEATKLEEGGPVNELMNTLSIGKEVTYTDINTGQPVTSDKSILETNNFVAAIAGGNFSEEEANNFSRDRALMATELGEDEIVGTTVVMDGQEETASVLGIADGDSADSETMAKTVNSIDVAIVQENSETFQSVIGGNRIVGGGSFISNQIDQEILGAMGSDEETILSYDRETEKILSLEAEADRATKSPFDISTPNTLLGSIVYSLGKMIVSNYSNKSGAVSSMMGVVAGEVGNSVAELTGNVMADGGAKYTTLSGASITVKKAANARADLNGTAHNTITTKFVSYEDSDWVATGLVDENGTLNEDMQDFVDAMGRKSTIGTKSADVCNAYRGRHDGLWQNIKDFFANFLGLYDVCDPDAVPVEVATGAKNTLSHSNNNFEKAQLMSGFAFHEEVFSILSERENRIDRYKKEYYAKHPKDNSRAGKIASRSGMTKAEAEIALAYADYLTEIANYDATAKYVFNKTAFVKKDSLLIRKAKKTRDDIYLMWYGRPEYADSRNRNFVV